MDLSIFINVILPYLIVFIQFEIIYYVFESIFNGIMYNEWIAKKLGRKKETRLGFASIWMIFVGGILGICIDIVYQIPFIYKYFPMLALMVIGGILITTVELGSGMLLNKVLKWDCWDYSDWRFNFKGQIELFHCIGWIALSPIAYWIDNIIRYYVSGKGDLIINPFIYYIKIISDFIR